MLEGKTGHSSLLSLQTCLQKTLDFWNSVFIVGTRERMEPPFFSGNFQGVVIIRKVRFLIFYTQPSTVVKYFSVELLLLVEMTAVTLNNRNVSFHISLLNTIATQDLLCSLLPSPTCQLKSTPIMTLSSMKTLF